MNSKAPWTDALSNNELPAEFVQELNTQIVPANAEYFDSPVFAWVAGTEISVAHNVGRRPDIAVVWFDSAVYGWNKQADKFKDGATYFGWSSNDGVGVSTDNVEVIYLFTPNTNEVGRNGRIRLLWFASVDVPNAP